MCQALLFGPVCWLQRLYGVHGGWCPGWEGRQQVQGRHAGSKGGGCDAGAAASAGGARRRRRGRLRRRGGTPAWGGGRLTMGMQAGPLPIFPTRSSAKIELGRTRPAGQPRRQ